MDSMMSSLSVFSGAGTILGPLISMAGPGIMVTVTSMIAPVVMSTVLTPLFSQFNSTVLSNDLDTLMAPLGGLQNGSLAILDNIAALTSVTSQPGVTSQDSGSGYISQSTGSSVGTTSFSNPLSSLGSSGTCDVTAIGTCLANELNETLYLGKAVLDNSNGPFSTFTTIAGLLFTAMETLTGSSSVPATSATTKAISSLAATATTSTTNYPLMLGILAVTKDLMGLTKTFDTTDPIWPVVTQFVRVILDAFQFYLSIQFSNQDASNVGSYLWIWKSTISTENDVLTLMDNVNTVTGGFSGLPSQVPLDTQQSDLSFSKLTLQERVMIQVVGAVGSILIVSFDQSLIPSNQQWEVDVFTAAYVIQRGLKAGLYVYRLLNPKSTDKKVEQLLYGLSIVVNIIQYLSTLT